MKQNPVELTTVEASASGEFEPAGTFNESDPDQERAYYDFQASAAQEGGGYSLWVYQVPTDAEGNALAGKLERLFSAPIDRYKLDEILDRVATEYMEPADRRWLVRIHIRKDGESQIKRNMLFVVRRNLKQSNVDSDNNILSAVSKMLNEQSARQQSLLLQVADSRRSAAPAADPMQGAIAMMTAMAGMMGPLLAAVSGRPAAPATDPLAMITGMASAMRTLKGLGDDLNGGGGGGESESGTVGLIKALSPMGAALMNMIAATKAGSVSPQLGPVPATPAQLQPAPQIPSPPPAAVPVPDNVLPFPATPGEPPTDAQLIMHLKTVLAGLAEVAGPATDAKAAADHVMSLMPDDERVDSMIFERLNSPMWWQGLVMLEPKIAPHKEWFGTLRDAILAGFEGEAEPPASA